MKPTIPFNLCILALILFSLNACAQSATPATESPTLVPTQTVVPTSTSTSTPTALPTDTAVPPTATLPAPDKVLEYLNHVQVVSIDTFDTQLSSRNWYFDLDIRAVDGVLEIPGRNWWPLMSTRRPFAEGQGVVLDFHYTRGSFFEIYVQNGSPNDSFYKAFCVFIEKNQARTNVWAAQNSLGGETIPGDLILQADTDYSLMLVIIPDGEFLMVVWKPSDPSKVKYYHEKIGKNWSDLPWQFGIAAKTGSLFIDNYQEIKFDGIK